MDRCVLRCLYHTDGNPSGSAADLVAGWSRGFGWMCARDWHREVHAKERLTRVAEQAARSEAGGCAPHANRWSVARAR
jgi:hypothetical protein